MDFHPVEANLRQSFRVLADGRPRADLIELPGITIASLAVAFQMFNAAFLSAPVADREDLEDRLELARGHFRSRGLSWAFWVCEDYLDLSVRRRLTPTCERYGLRLSSEMPGMIAPVLVKPGRPLPPLEFRRVDSLPTLNDFRGIGSICFHVPLEWFSEVFDESVTAPRAAFVCWVGYYDGVPVATAASVASDGVTGLYNIATAPGYRGRAFAEAITRHTAAAAGPCPLVLQSTSRGLRLYERLGFRPVTRILVYNSV